MPALTSEQKKGAIAVGAVLVLVGLFYSVNHRRDMANADRAIEQATGATYTNDQGTVSVTGGEGGVLTYQGANGEVGTYQGANGENAKVPEGFPSDFPVMADAKLTTAYSGIESGGTHGYNLVWEVSGSVSDTLAFYKRELAAKGWTVSTATETGEQAMIGVERAGASTTDKDGGAVMIDGQDGKTTVNVTLGLH